MAATQSSSTEDPGNSIDLNNGLGLPDLMPISRQQTDQTANEHEIDEKTDDSKSIPPNINNDPFKMVGQFTRQKTNAAIIEKTQSQSDIASLSDMKFLPITRQTTDQQLNTHQNEEKLASISIPDVSSISRQKTNLAESIISDTKTTNDMKFGGLIRQKTNMAQSMQSLANEEDIVTPLSNMSFGGLQRQQTDPEHNKMNAIKEEVHIQSKIKHIPSKIEQKNEYLDNDLIMFDDDGKLLNNSNEASFIGLDDQNNDDDIEQFIDDSMNQFIEHKEAIICMAINPKNAYQVASGSQDEHCLIWDMIKYDPSSNTNTNEEFIKLNAHSDTILDVSWNYSSKYLATASMDGSIKIFHCNKDFKQISSLECDGEVSFLCWHSRKKYKNILMAGSFDKNVWIYDYNKQTKQFGEIQVLSGHSAEITCGGFSKFGDTKYGYSGDKDGVIIIWENVIDCDAFCGTKKHCFKPIAHKSDIGLYHESEINAIDDCLSAPLLISGSCDGSVCLINYENGKIICKLGKHKDTIECVKFQKINKCTNYASSSSMDGMIKIWDLNKGKVRSELKHNDGVIVHEWLNTEKNAGLMVSGCMNGIVYLWDTRMPEIVKEFKGHGKVAIQSVVVSMDDKYAVSGGDDSIAMVWQLFE